MPSIDDRRPRPPPHEPRHDRPQRKGFVCPHCGSTFAPVVKSKISPLGWVVLVLGTPFCLIGLVGLAIRDDYRVCPGCGASL